MLKCNGAGIRTSHTVTLHFNPYTDLLRITPFWVQWTFSELLPNEDKSYVLIWDRLSLWQDGGMEWWVMLRHVVARVTAAAATSMV
jgi:hypothetical protein